jgi:hypothetical protein
MRTGSGVFRLLGRHWACAGVASGALKTKRKIFLADREPQVAITYVASVGTWWPWAVAYSRYAKRQEWFTGKKLFRLKFHFSPRRRYLSLAVPTQWSAKPRGSFFHKRPFEVTLQNIFYANIRIDKSKNCNVSRAASFLKSQTANFNHVQRLRFLLVPRNFSRGRGVIPSLAERGGAILSEWVLPVWNVASW